MKMYSLNNRIVKSICNRFFLWKNSLLNVDYTRFFNHFFKTVTILFVIVFFLLLILIPLFVGLKYGLRPSETEYSIQYISVFLSSFSFGAVILTLWKQHKDEKLQQEQIKKNFEFAQHNYESQILDKIHFFTSDSMSKCRSGACRLWFQVEAEPLLRNKVKDYFIMTITNTEGDNEGIEEEDFYKDFCAFFKLIRYFNVMSFYTFNEITANAVHYYYVYYRNFFKDMIDIYNEACDSIDKQKQVTTVRENWIYLVEKMDAIMNKNNLPLE